MQRHWHDQELQYDGSQLRSHWIYESFAVLGNAMAGFIGPCQVDLDKMVDLEDVAAGDGIYSPKMLHWIVEDFNINLTSGILLQRMMVVILQEVLQGFGVTGLLRRGDDLYLAEKKLNVSIATRSPVSTLIHLGVNVETEGTPVPTVGLSDWEIIPKDFAMKFTERFTEEYQDLCRAAYKVRPVV